MSDEQLPNALEINGIEYINKELLRPIVVRFAEIQDAGDVMHITRTYPEPCEHGLAPNDEAGGLVCEDCILNWIAASAKLIESVYYA